MQGFYAVHYRGPAGRGAFGFVLINGQVVAVDPTGGHVTGTYAQTPDGGLNLDVVFLFKAGAALVTGQVLTSDMRVPATITVKAATLVGAEQPIKLPFGTVTARIERIADLPAGSVKAA